MSAEPIAPYYNDLMGSFAAAKAMLARGVADRRSPSHAPSIASIGLDGRPRLRTVILRSFDPAHMQLRFNTDRRSEKIAELSRDPRIAMHFYDAGAKVQLRVEGTASLHTDDEIAEQAWSGSRSFSQACYGVMPAPGTRMAEADGFSLPASELEIAAGRTHFSTVRVSATSVEWLYLAHSGHRRALFASGDGAQWAGQWLTP
jgi:pyridoxamine 5'-phosphate oxidase